MLTKSYVNCYTLLNFMLFVIYRYLQFNQNNQIVVITENSFC